MKVKAVFGPPGTGKTTTLMQMAEGLKCLFLSYTRAAAQEAASRIQGGSQIRASTLHSLAFNALNMNRSAVVDASKMAEFAKASGIPFKGSEPGSDEIQEGDDYLSVIQFANNRLMDPMEAYEHFGKPGTQPRFVMCYSTYGSWKKTYGYMDFDDMLSVFCKTSLSTLPVPPGSTVFLDEAQDCSPLQWKAFSHLCALIKPKLAVLGGDDDQAIYEWSGADPHGMINFVNRVDGEIKVLQQSYRVPRQVYAEATRLVEKITSRVPKKYKPRPGSDAPIERWGDADNTIDHLQEIAPDSALILVRDRFKMEEVKRSMNRELIPYDVQNGHSPWTSKIANALRRGEKTEIPMAWREFYAQADLSLPVKYRLSTIHGAKGREHDTVIMDLDLPARTLMGLSLDPDAETRVQYVGMTRAKEKLVLCGSNPIV